MFSRRRANLAERQMSTNCVYPRVFTARGCREPPLKYTEGAQLLAGVSARIAGNRHL